MIDVRGFYVGAPCPHHANRRVIAIERNEQLWRCAPSMAPFPLPEQIEEHDAKDRSADEQFRAEFNQGAKR